MCNKIVKEIDLHNVNEGYENELWEECVSDFISSSPENVFDICLFGFTEILNNSIEHSKGSKIRFIVEQVDNVIHICIVDDGIGIFSSIASYLNLRNNEKSIVELFKGGVTTKPDNHSGQGIFFSSKMFDNFSIHANGICISCAYKDWYYDYNTPDNRDTK